MNQGPFFEISGASLVLDGPLFHPIFFDSPEEEGEETEDFLGFGDTSLLNVLRDAHEDGWKHPEEMPPQREMSIVTVINLLEQDYCE